MDDEFWKSPGEQEFVGEKSNRIGAVNMALLFGTAAIALSLILTPLLTTDKDRMEASTMGYDDIKTGSIPTEDGKIKRYTIRRSVLQDNPGEVCIIDQDRNRNGC
ncbi:hypothetical protein JJB09_21975 [Rhizobium sp. KVB221]|uniref:Transmembrane protein n=1 Tax=Rhizobium setariae TaxID=2801340 RepID=A0A936YVP6_9HYPH|nr:hypothetical protein [Rhizobium setariae]MBL0374686.1 hypothetical protein [Rhizobium setariae]